ncbi:adhesion G-protein coupled receptor D1-like [Amphiura filiformis]|uniref:adhesion G-protein coupled receptor D1-like n=1 Tax=Amphiura filiformis TaxID=82378 RepID=UPI003B211105
MGSGNSREGCILRTNENSTATAKQGEKVASSLMKTIEDFAVNLGTNLLSENQTEVVIANDNLVVKIQALSISDSEENQKSVSIEVNETAGAISLPISALKGKTVKVTTVVYKTLHNAVSNSIEGSEDNNSTTISTNVISLSISGTNLTFSEEDPVALTFAHLQNKSANQTPRCSYWKFDASADSGGVWSTDGCVADSSSITSTTCHCTHLTNFAVLMQVNPNAKPIPTKHGNALESLTYIGTSLSVLALVLTMVIFISLKLLKSQRTAIHANLAVSLGSAQFFYLVGIDATENKGGCTFIAVLLHYLFTASICWMWLEGVHLYTCTKSTGVFGKRFKTRVWMAVGWGAPALIVIVSAAVRPNGYGTETSCWISVQQGLAWAFVIPVLFVVLMNCIILFLVLQVFVTLKANADKSEKERIRIALRAVLVLQPVLGLTWFFGLLAAYDTTMLFAYLFVIFNSSQGIFIFLLHCLSDNEVSKSSVMFVIKWMK